MNKESLLHYCELIDEVEDTCTSIQKIRTDIKKIEKQLAEIENGHTVKDKVYGGEGGWQGFVIEGVPIAEYSRLKIILGNRKICLEHELEVLEVRVTMLDNERIQVQEFISRLKDPQIRRIITFRCVQRLPWMEVARRMGAGYTDDAVRKVYARFLEKEIG